MPRAERLQQVLQRAQKGDRTAIMMVALLVAWLTLIFASFGFRAPRNATIVCTCLISGALVAAAIYLIIDMDTPFSGPIQVSPAPLQRALAALTQ